MAQWIRVAAEADCPVGELKGVMADGVPVVLANVDGNVCALRDRCSDDAYAASAGALDGNEVVCQYHGARFDACSGARKTLPAIRAVQSFPVEIRDGEVWIDVG